MTNIRHALITGASEGIGRSFATHLANEGWRITAVARNEARLASLLAELPGTGHAFLACDLSTAAGAAKVVARMGEGHVDLLINNAGFGVYGPFHVSELERLQAMLHLNVETLVTLAHAFLGQAERGDALINVSSALAFLPMPQLAAYAATKAFVTSFSDALWFEQKRRGVYVMGLCPGATETNFHERAGGLGGKPPKNMTEGPDDVVKTALRALAKRRQPVVISGAVNRFGAFVSRVVPRRGLVNAMGKARP